MAVQQRHPPCFLAFVQSAAHHLNAHRFALSTSKCQARRDLTSVYASVSGSNGSSGSTHRRLWLPDSSATHRLGSLLGQDPRPSDVVLLSGALGAGKTCFARGYIQTVRSDISLDVTSPTYLLVNAYPPDQGEKGPTVYHMDLWRLNAGTKRAIVDFDEVFQKHVSIIEWPDRLQDRLPSERLGVLLEYPETDAEVDENDPWGFGSGDPDDMGAAREGRFATLLPVGTHWEERANRIHDEVAVLDEVGRLVIADR